MKLILGKKFDEQPEIKDQNPVSKSAADGILKPAVEKAAIAGMVKAVPVAKIKQPVLPIRSVIGASPDSVSRSAVSKTAIADIAKAVSAAETKQPVLTADNLKTMQAEKVPGITPDEVLPARRQFLYEAVEKREQNGKHYVANDGTVTAIFQNQAVHFLDPSDNKFKDIDNSLRDIGNVLEAKTSDFNIQFNKNLAQGKVFELTKKDCAVSLISREVTAVRSGLKLENTASLNRVQSELILKNIKDNTDFQYIVESDRVKENIIINKKADSYEYNFDLNIENLTVNMSNDGKILELKSKKTSEVVFSIPAPSITDAKGAYSDFVYYEIENQNEKTLNLKVVASAEWLNAGDRVFPAVINPQIVSKDTSLFLLDKISDSINDMSVLTVKKDLLNLDSQKISKVTLKLQPNLGEILGVYHSFDITDIFIEAKKDLIIELKPDFTLIPVIPIRPEYVIPNFPPIKSNPPIAISIEDIGGQNPPIIRPGKDPILEVEYLTSDDSVPAKEDFALAGGVTGALNLNTGEFVTGFTDAITKNSALACKISHVYKKNSTNYGCGKNWRLNLHQTLVKNTAVNAGVDYIYTDSDGEKHGFIETYYYLDSSNNKVTVPKNDVIVELDGSLWYKSGSAYEVFKDQRTATGLTLTTKMEGFKNVENLEQRQNEQKQIEEYIESCKNSFKECVIAQTSDGKIIWELKNYFSGELLSAEFNKFVSNGFTSGRMILSKGEAMQYASLLIQKKQVEDQLDAMNKQKMTLNNSITSLGNSITSLDHNKNSINTQIEALVCQRESLKMQLDILKKDDKKNQDQRTNLDNQIQLIGEKNSTSPVIVNSVTLDTQIRYLEIQRNDLTTQKADLTTQKNDLTTQKNDIDKSISSMQSQKTATVKQIEYISGKISDNLKELKRIFKEYTNKEFELKKLKEQMPVSYLSDGNSFLCFNEAGKLCAITDNYSNYISIEYDNNGRISKVYDGKRATVLKYNFYGQLVSITDYRGKKTTYTYSSTSASGNLTKATYSDGNTLEFVYAGEEVTSISSSADKTKTLLAYSSGKLSAITNQSTVSSITDTSAGLAAAAILTSEITVSAVNINYSVNECAITTDGKLNWYIMDRLGNLVGGYSKLTDGTDEERLSYSYFDRANNWCYLAKETDDPVALPSGRQVSTASGKRTFGSYNEAQTFLTDEYAFASGNNLTSSLSGLQKDFSAYVLSKNSETSITVQAASLPAGKIEFMFSAYAAAENAPVTDMRFGTSFRTLPAGGSDQKFEIIAEVNYKNKPAQTFVASFDYKNKGKQFCALPVTLDKSLLADLQNIVLKHVYTGSGAAAFTDFRLAPCEWEYKTFDQFKNISFSETGTVLLNKGISSNAYEKSVVNYKYDDEHRLITKRLTRTTNGISNNINIIGTNKNDTVNHAVSKYYYNDYGSIVRTEKYIEGEEGSKGILAEETVHDEKGNVIKSVIYNTLDSTAKSYSENEYSENGRLKAKIDETGENRTVIEYAPDTDDVQTVINPDGGKLSYGRDYITGAVTGITQSTEAGESNSIETKYTYGVITGLKSGLNTVNYEYDAKRRKTRVLLNDKERVKYEYTENAQSYGITVNDIDFDSITSDKITATLKGDARPVILTPPILPGTPPYIPPPYNGDNLPDIKTETITDKRGNLIRVSVDDSVQFANSYNNYNALVKSADNITGSMLTTTYDDANKRATKSGRTAGTKPGYKYLAAVSESYGYNDRGELSERTVSINETAVQTYVYAYKNNAARNLDSINLPNDLLYKPQTDAMGRNAGRLLTDLSGNNKFGEYINYRKVGDRTTDMVSSIRYGEVKDGQYVIGNGLDYKYDGRGNITEIWESGELTVTYTYDKLQRLVREDNMSKGKSWFYSYDNNGNILSKKEADYTRKPADEITEYNYKKLYSYDGDKLTGCGGESFDYDVFGNPKKYRDKTLKWQECKLVDFNGITFAYDGYGKRVKKGDVIYTYDIGGKLLRQSDGTDTLEFIYDESGLSGVKYGDMQYVYRKNIQGDITHIFDINGELAASYNYDAWGNHTVSDSEGNPITGASHIGNLNPFRYRGYLYDIETKLYYLQTRYYDPEIGRFISQDEISYLDPSTINGLNLYAYCGNNPVMRIDETGYSWKSFWKAFGRFAIGLIIMVVAVVTVVSLLITMPILFALPVVGGFLTQTFISAIMYGGFVLASSWDKQIRADMNAIGWNPFNTNEDAVLESGKVSFYKGMPVVRTNLKRSGSFGAILLRRRDSDGNKIEVNELRHEWGHGAQHLIMGSILYGVSIAIPSALSDAENPNYYDSPWEVTADMLGGVSRHHGDGAERAGKDYFIFSMLCYLGLFI